MFQNFGSTFFSVSQALKKGFQIGNEGLILTLKKNNILLKFDRTFHTAKGFVVGVNLIPQQLNETTHLGLAKHKPFHISTFHGCLTHPGESTTRLTADYYKIPIKSPMPPCDHCALSKAKQSKLSKTTDTCSEVKGERLCIDISYISKPSYGGSQYWLLMMDDCTGYLWSKFLKFKSDMAQKVVALIKQF